jgi:trans-aconitate 2-methyltransferase
VRAARNAPAWSAAQYLKFEDERTRPARELLAQVPLSEARLAVDLGCGPGTSTALIAARFPEARVVGLDSDQDMLAAARKRLPGCEFVAADISTWQPERGTDLLYANAVFQWVPDHREVLRRLFAALAPGGTLAIQVPDNLDEPSHALMREVARSGPWAAALTGAIEARGALGTPGEYYDLLVGAAARVDVWHTFYQHPIAGPGAIVEWFKGTSLRPFIDPLDEAIRAAFLAAYEAAITPAYPRRADGRVLLRFPRLFLVAVRG